MILYNSAPDDQGDGTEHATTSERRLFDDHNTLLRKSNSLQGRSGHYFRGGVVCEVADMFRTL